MAGTRFPRILLILAAPALPLAALFACSGGGSPAQPVGPGTTTVTDAQPDVTVEASADEGGAIDADSDVRPGDAMGPTDASAADGQCPAMFPPTCEPGQTCLLACNLCACVPDGGGLWACTAKGCPASGNP